MSRRCANLFLALCLVGASSLPAWADGEAPPPAESAPPPVESAPPAPDQPLPLSPADGIGNLTLRETTERGIRLFREGRYDEAIQEFTAAYVLSPKPMFLFNIAQAHRKAGRPREALINYQLFLQKAPDTPLRPETEAYIELVQTQLRTRAEAPPPPVASPPPVVAAPPPVVVASPPSAPAVEQRPPLYRRPWVWGVVGATVAVVGGVAVGVYFGTRPPTTTLGIIEPTF